MTRVGDQHRQAALGWQAWLEANDVRSVTTEAVLWEWLNGLADPMTRQQAAAGCRLVHDDDLIEVVPFEPSRNQVALDLYGSRPDKGWSLTDCFSFLAMQDHHLVAALTTDHHYQQAGFRALMLEEPPS